ncbi:AraC family transcriptional regulator [Coraliomargarita algicola]|uniref:AraC family transcriptional regulator n=1 Tax=Coraliomargarita algicola TaxID=3092156 RepID=A0ABZ0RMJ9_9BACT|nr:AraC family transcriptional regulator [Coraliomargarita sp. J2-16]WPJ96459.1 AraC family transcriptional regulator [Coraliomargarita sp. J2-16]
MISGYKNLRYLAYGERRYGIQPIFGKMRNLWEFEFILSGDARPSDVQIPRVATSQARLYISHPHSEHGWTDDSDGVSEVFVLHFFDIPEELQDRIEATKPLIIELSPNALVRYTSHFENIKNSVSQNDALTSLSINSFLLDLTELALKHTPHFPLRTDPLDKVDRALHWFQENLGRSPSVADAASAVGVSAAHLRRMFAEAKRPSPKSELARLQMEAAQRSLLEGWPQKAIANYLGFSEPSTFARAFKELCGQAPGIWLQEQQRQELPRNPEGGLLH